MLLGLASLPALWWLMRATPPKPIIEKFPAVRLLFNLDSEDKQPVRMPLWQRLLRLSAAALIVAGLAEPQFEDEETLDEDGPVMVVVDNDWSSARNWPLRHAEMQEIIEDAKDDGRKVVILSTAPTEAGQGIQSTGPLDADAASEVVKGLKPMPWPADRAAAAAAIDTLAIDDASVIWLSNGLDDGEALDLVTELQEKGKLTIIEDEADAGPRLLALPENSGHELAVTVKRAEGGDDIVKLVASDENGQVIKQIEAKFEKGETETTATFDLPIEVRNQVTRITIDNENSAGATVLLDERWRRRPVGLIGNTGQASASLLDASSYVERALSPYVDLSEGNVTSLLERDLAVMILTDDVSLNSETQARVAAWVEGGGTLLRFSGPRLAAQPEDALLPVDLRKGERSLGSGMAGTAQGRLAPFDQGSPFYGIALPDHVRVYKEVLAQPGPETEERTWARLEDGSPLVTAKKQGEGWVVLVHTTANPDWSNLSLSGLFVEMMRAVVAHSQGVAGSPEAATKALPPIITLDGRGNLTSPLPGTLALGPDAIKAGTINSHNPPGFYGDESGRHAHNLFNGVGALTPLPDMPDNVTIGAYENGVPDNLMGKALTGAFALLLLDLLILMGQRGQLPGINRRKSDPAPPGPA